MRVRRSGVGSWKARGLQSWSRARCVGGETRASKRLRVKESCPGWSAVIS